MVREVRHDYERSLKIPVDHATESAEVNSKSIQAWQKAREENETADLEAVNLEENVVAASLEGIEEAVSLEVIRNL